MRDAKTRSHGRALEVANGKGLRGVSINNHLSKNRCRTLTHTTCLFATSLAKPLEYMLRTVDMSLKSRTLGSASRDRRSTLSRYGLGGCT